MYEIEMIYRGEEFRYTNGDLSLVIDRTYCAGHRIFTDSIKAQEGHAPLSFNEITMIIKDLCDFFNTNEKKTIFVIRESDPHRNELDALMIKLIESGEKIIVEIDTEIKRQAIIDKQNIDALKQGCKVTIDSTIFTSPEQYWKWRRDV